MTTNLLDRVGSAAFLAARRTGVTASDLACAYLHPPAARRLRRAAH